ncbi:MAG: Hsp20/alpha crystallin family protein [Hyphomonadaceae bacterium]|nr:Hsp20/alpha crystallin family protein [Hyphomonadaceae bacterium]
MAAHDEQGARPRGGDLAPYPGLGGLYRDFFQDFGSVLDTPFFRNVGAPRLDVSDAGNAVLVECDLPGVKADEVEIALEGDRLTIKGERKAEREDKGKNYYVSERSFGAFSRALVLPFEPAADAVEARFEDGVLHISIKKPAARAKSSQKIAIRS